MMLRRWEFWTLTVLALAGVALAGMNMMLYQGNRAAQAEIAGRQQYIAQSVQLEGLYREIVKALADLSVKAQDGDLRNLLAARASPCRRRPFRHRSLPPSLLRRRVNNHG